MAQSTWWAKLEAGPKGATDPSELGTHLAIGTRWPEPFSVDTVPGLPSRLPAQLFPVGSGEVEEPVPRGHGHRDLRVLGRGACEVGRGGPQ